MRDRTPHLKNVVVGDGGIGKTSMLITKLTGKFPIKYLPVSAFDIYQDGINIKLPDTVIKLYPWDTASGKDYDKIRPLSYPNTHVIILMFDIAAVARFNFVEKDWLTEVRSHCTDVPIVLVGSKSDLRESNCETISSEQGKEMAEKIGAAVYMEVSSIRNEGLDELFQEVGRIAYEYHKLILSKKKKN